MSFEDDMKKIGQLSGRAVFLGITIGSVVAAEGIKLVDTGLSTANDLAGEFSGYKGKNIVTPEAKKITLNVLSQTKDLALWGEKKLRA